MRLQTKPMIKQLILLGSFYLLLSPALGWTSEGEDTFSSVMQQTATELASQYKGKQPLHLLISQNYFRMKRTGENLPLSSFVEEEMKTKLVQTGKFILSHAYEEGKKQGILVGNYYREPGKIVFHLSILSEQETILSAAKASIHDQAIPSKWLQNEIPRKAIEIVQKISDKFTAQKKSVLLKEPIKVYVENIPDSKGRFSAFSSQFRQEIIHAMTGNFNFKVTAKRDIASVPTHRIKTRKMIVTEKSSPGTMMAQQIQAGAVLRGTYMKVGKTLRVNMELVDPVGNFLSSEGISIGLDIIKVAYQTKKEKESSPTQTNTLPSKLKLVLNLDKGDGSVYKVGEKVRVLIHVSHPTYLALYNKDSQGEWCQIIPNPYFPAHNKFQPSRTYVLGDHDDNFEIPIAEPVGEEWVVGFISEVPLPKPSILKDGCTKKGKAIYDAYRLFAFESGRGYGEGKAVFWSKK